MSSPPPPGRLLNRELSWLDFDRRVLDLASDLRRPLLERLKFIAIYAQNLDEFFQVRVAGLQDRLEAEPTRTSADGLTPGEQLAEIQARVSAFASEAQALFEHELRPALAVEGISLVGWDELDARERREAQRRFDSEVHPLLIPLAVDSAHPFPYLSGLSLSVGAVVAHTPTGEERFARIKVPSFVKRFFDVGNGRYVPIEEMIQALFQRFFPEDEILEVGCFRVTRDADLDVDDRDTVDLASEIEHELRRRNRQSDAVRLEVDRSVGPLMRSYLMHELDLDDADVYRTEGMLDLGALFELVKLDRPELKDPPWTPRRIRALNADRPAEFFQTVRERDFLVHHPYQSFEGSVEELLRAASQDPQVLVIMSTLYRTGGPESGIVQALEQAAAFGKQVLVLVELKARFEEAANLERARSLERAGAHVVYGVMGLKTHAKLALVIRAEEDGLRRYCHVGTGNYNPVTARLYEDIGLLTSSPEITLDAAEVFQRLTSGSGARDYARLLVAPERLRDGLLARIREQTHRHGRIVFKMNSLADPPIIEALYAASQAGAKIDLVVRGICCLRPGVSGLSENIRVRSIVGRFLEHSRIFRFGDPVDGAEHWLGSADLMPRNLDLRVETLVPVDDPALRSRLDRVLAVYLQPDIRTWELGPDGRWKQSAGRLDAQEIFIRAIERHDDAR